MSKPMVFFAWRATNPPKVITETTHHEQRGATCQEFVLRPSHQFAVPHEFWE